ncbi:MAG: hypothetical protein HC831_26425 [Chloroflexia bacterium]|nr:hypothetical protein [Chloroflexia bacterium]
MYGLRINSAFLDLLPESSISLELNNPIFADDIIPGSFSLPFDLPLTDRNRQVLGYPELLNLSGRPAVKIRNVELWILGIPWRSGELILRGFQNGNYRTNFQTDTSLLAEKFNNLNLRELNHETVQLFDWSVLSSGINSGYDARKFHEYTIPYGAVPSPLEVTVNGDTFSSDAASGQDRLISVMDQINASDLEVTCDIDLALSGGQNNFLRFRTPGSGLQYALEVTIRDSDPPVCNLSKSWVAGYTTWIENDYRALKYQAVIPDDFVLPCLQIDNFYEGIELNMTGAFNVFSNDNYQFRRTTILGTEFITRTFSFIPCFTLSYVFRKIEEATGVRFIGDFIEDPEYQTLILFNTHSLDYFEKENGILKHVLSDIIEPGNHLPDLSVNEFLRQLARTFNLGYNYSYDDATIELYAMKPIIDSLSYQELTGKFNPQYSMGDFEFSDGFTLKFAWDEKDLLQTNQVDAVVSGAGELELSLKMHTVQMQNRQKPDSGEQYRIPVASQAGTWYGKDPEGKNARLLFMRGLFPGTLGDGYKYASSDNKNIQLVEIPEVNYTLQLAGYKGLYKLRWENWAEILAGNTTATRTGYWSITDLLNFNFRQKYRVDQLTWLIKKIRFSVSSRGLMPAEIEMMKAE